MAINNEQNKVSYAGDMMIFLSTGTGTTYPVAFSTNATLNVTVATREISSKDSGYWTDKAAGKISWDASSDALYCYTLTSGTTRNTYDELYAMMIAREAVNFVFGKTSGSTPNWSVDSGEDYYSGDAIITSLNLNSPDGDNSTYSITLEGTGELDQT